MNQLTEVVKNLIIVNVIIFALKLLPLMDYVNSMLPLYIPTSDLFKPFQIVTHMFSHANPSHLIFNMIGLYFFGPWLERSWGPKRFLAFYLICGMGATIAHLLIGFDYGGSPYQSVLGASGAISGVVIGFAMLFPNVQVMLLLPPMPIKAKYMAAIYIGIDLYMGVGGTGSNVAHWAHLGGALTGALLILFWRKYPPSF